MPKKRHSAEQTMHERRAAEVAPSQGQTVGAVCKQLGVTQQSHHRWREEYGSLEVDQAKQLEDLEQENGLLKKLVDDQAPDNAILLEVAQGNP